MLVALGCSAPPGVTTPLHFVDCQPLRDVSLPASSGFSTGPRMVPAAGSVTVAFGLVETCVLDLSSLRPSATVTGPDNVAHEAPVRVSRRDPGDGLARVIAEVELTADVPGWWLVQVALEPGWAQHQVLAYAMESRASTPRHVERTGQDVSACGWLQRTRAGTWVCRGAAGELQSRPGFPPGALGDVAVVSGDVAWAVDRTRLVRFEDSSTGLRTAASLGGAFGVEQVDGDAVLLSDFEPSSGTRRRRLVTVDADGGLVSTAPAAPFDAAVLVDGGLVELCPGPACGTAPVGLGGGQVYFLDRTFTALLRAPLDGGAATRVELGPGVLRSFASGFVAGRPLGIRTPEGHVALLAHMDGEPRVVWLGGDVVGVGDGVAFLRGAAADEVVVVPLDFD